MTFLIRIFATIIVSVLSRKKKIGVTSTHESLLGLYKCTHAQHNLQGRFSDINYERCALKLGFGCRWICLESVKPLIAQPEWVCLVCWPRTSVDQMRPLSCELCWWIFEQCHWGTFVICFVCIFCVEPEGHVNSNPYFAVAFLVLQ